MKHIIRPYEDQRNVPIDRNDPLAAATAIEIRFPDSFSDRAKKVIDYLDGTMFLFAYKGRFVATDESLYLTDHGDGSCEAPYGGPRWSGSSLNELERWLELTADAYDMDEDIPGWEVDVEETPVIVTVNVRTFYSALKDALKQGFTTIFCRRTYLHMPLEQYIKELEDEDDNDSQQYARFGNIIVDVTDEWKEEAEIYELE